MSAKENFYKPDWTPKDAGKEFAVRIVKAKESGENPVKNEVEFKSGKPETSDIISGILQGNRNYLARAITLIESNSQKHRPVANAIIRGLLPNGGKSLRIGITGIPGAGKSTLIETLGLYLISLGHKVAVLAIDPSSSISRGSILGDKTRMEKLSREPNCFIRPSPSSGTLGGVTRKSRETILACESAGYDVIIIETVGVGQSEITVRSMVDFFLLVLIAGGGDELQGIKKGIIEIADAIVINKADGDNIQRSNMAKAEYTNAVHYIAPATQGWQTSVMTCSALVGSGVTELWQNVLDFEKSTKSSGFFQKRRKNQALDWMLTLVEEEIKNHFYNSADIKEILPHVKKEVIEGKKLPTEAAEELLKRFYSGNQA
ncbi:MAG: methylmalonyl Co-A mutase-associated GTPase MeaB [Ignavibacteriales bacterium]|nr:methylmalonyl Co-A mutase-associated GTPase MeaB [Ignavibacteriales bacterium]MCF8307195.1 methylmalonyl Co-A mutase-associated GTPase MeaB [Ignavibacteriales bacterium]MCF8315200.1 methylmalonyl Co-A mutase-associated GTPase MeaB [Ignavibacteriales bacterium]MCF8438475.1 methylmalonyl Co-A mutase-associated GTPase MeaB [Ignavibacteriales bacterium]